MKATRIKTITDMRGDAAVYRLDPPMDGHEYVVVSAVDVLGEPETYIFQSDDQGNIPEDGWCELDGSFKGALDHEMALSNAGYEVEQ